jgi:LysM repeat protein
VRFFAFQNNVTLGKDCITMKKTIKPCFILGLIAWTFLSFGSENLSAKEDSARLYFQKAVAGKQKPGSYVVKRGDCLYRILKRQHITMSQLQHQNLIRLIGQLNPDLKNPNVIYPGQMLVLPEGERAGASVSDYPTVTYTARRGDSLTKIAMRELNVKQDDVYRTLQVIRQLNPDIRNLDKIIPGQALKLPEGAASTATAQEAATGAAETAREEKVEGRQLKATLPENCLAAIRHILGRMGGYMITTGKYYIPLPRSGQANIDCTVIPVIELDDGSTILLDISSQLPVTIKKMIQGSWNNYFIVNVGLNEGIAQMLQKAINASPSYGMSKESKPIVLGSKPEIQLALDWMITKKKASGNRDYIQGLSFLNDKSQILPPPMTAFAEKSGVGITEVLEGCTIVSKPGAGAAALDVPALNTTSGKDLIQALLIMLGYSTTRDDDVRIFDPAKDGFNLTIKADLLVTAGDKRFLFHWRKLPSQFIDILKKGGTEVVLIGAEESNRAIIEKTLRALNISFSFNRYIYSMPEQGDRVRGIINFPALRVEREPKPLYLIDFDMDRDIYGLLHNRWEVNVLRY